ncbi:MAG: DUF559 domain-containing protein [Chloroflexi bacterium]|nr:DUF559 domain-containing protein [Chloroflexota bacterium]
MTSYLRHYIMAEDERREKVLSALGLMIVRFGNEEVMRNLSAVVRKIKESVLIQ